MDLDEEIRTELLLDVGEWLPETGAPDGILITGDVAFSGQENQYSVARAWLRKLADAVGCDPENVWVVPGNHDVDRGIIRRSPLLQMVQNRVRNHAPGAEEAVNGAVREVCGDGEMSGLLMAPLEGFNAFAGSFGGVCCTSTDGLAWQHDLDFDGPYTLRLWGINSAFVSNRDDDLNRLVVSRHQLPNREPGVVLVSLCHHPPSWVLDSTQVVGRLRQRASVQLYGHRHRRDTDHNVRSLTLHAGALHPERDDSTEWEPRYNVLQLRVDGLEEEPRLVVRVWGREWKDEEATFGPMTFGGQLVGEYPVILDAAPQATAPPQVDPPAAPAVPPNDLDSVRSGEPAYSLGEEAPSASPSGDEPPGDISPTADPPDDGPPPVHETTAAMDSMRSLVYRYYDLPYRHRQQIIVDLGLLRDEDKGLAERDLVRRVVERIRQGELTDEFRAAIESYA